MNLGKPGDVYKMDAIGRAKQRGRTDVATLLERFKNDATKTRSEVRKELGINGQSYLILSYSRPFSFSVHDFLHFYPTIFTFNLIVKKY